MKKEKEGFGVGLSADLQKIVDTLAEGGYEVCGIEPAGFVNMEKERPTCKVLVTKAVSCPS